MKTKQLNLIYALRKHELVHVSQVESGLKCDCVCPSCNAKLVARKGEKVSHHFAHYNAETCTHGYETSLHLAAKQIISEAKSMWIPAVHLRFSSIKRDELIKNAMQVHVDEVKLEKWMDTIVPDIIVSAHGKSFIVEIYVTHAIDEVKLAKIRALNISTIEIDLSKFDRQITREDLQRVLLQNVPEKQWKYNAVEEQWKKEFMNITDKRKIISRDFDLHVEECPIAVRLWGGKPCASYTEDCIGCQFFISHLAEQTKGEGYILCTGKSRIAHLEDFKLTLDERRKKYDPISEEEKTKAIASGHCPQCGGKFKEKHGKNGVFWGCNGYPKCRVTMNYDDRTGELKLHEGKEKWKVF